MLEWWSTGEQIGGEGRWSVNIKHNEKYVNAAFVDSKQLHSDDMEEHHKKYKK